MKQVLLNLGFDDKEADIYLALTKTGKASVNELIKNTTIERRTIYDVLERLVQKGRASYFEENNTRKYLPTTPEALLEDLQEKQRELQNIIPQLQALEQEPNQAKVEVLKGIHGIKTIFLEIAANKHPHYSFGNIEPFNKEYRAFTQQFLKNLERTNSEEKVIYAKGDTIMRIPGGEYRSMTRAMIPPTPTMIYGNVVIQYIYTNPITIIKITSKEIARTHKEYFNQFWSLAQPE